MKKVLSVLLICVIAMLTACGTDYSSKFDDSFIDAMTRDFGGCTLDIGTHQAYYDDSIGQYIGKGNFTDANGLEYEYSYRGACVDDELNFVKVSVYDMFGNKVVDHYDEDLNIKALENAKKE